MGPVMERSVESRPTVRQDVQRLLRLQVPVIVKLASKKMSVRTLTALRPGTIIEFDKRSDDELELMICNKTIGFGEAVKVGENFGLRVGSICDIRDTIRSLGDEDEGL